MFQLFLCLLWAARSTPNLSGTAGDEMDLDTSGQFNQKSNKDASNSPAIVRVPSVEDDWLTSFFASRPIADVVSHDVTVHDFDIVSSSSAATWACNSIRIVFQGRSDGGIWVFIPPKSAQVNFLWGKNDVRTAIQQFYTPQKTFIPPKQISGYAPGVFRGPLHLAACPPPFGDEK